MQISFKEGDILFELNIKDKICVLANNAGEGKSFLFRTLSEVRGEDWREHYFYFDYTNMNTLTYCKELFNIEDNIIVLDNSDLYIKDFIDTILNSKAYVILITKNLTNVVKLNYRFYKVFRNPDKVYVEKD